MATVWRKEESNDIFIKIILFCVSPFFSFLYSLRRMNTKSSFVFFFLFALFYGMSVSLDDWNLGIDSFSYLRDFQNYYSRSFSDYFDGLKDYLSFANRQQKDYYAETMYYITSRFTNNYHWLFLFIAFVFSFFQLKSLKIFVTEENFTSSALVFVLAFLFTWNQIFNINGFRFWTAAWIAVYGFLQVYYNNKKRYLILLFITPFFHGSFLVLWPIILIVELFRKNESLWFVLLIISFCVSNISIELLRNYSGYLPGFLGFLTESYTESAVGGLFDNAGTGFWIIGRIMDFLVRTHQFALVVILYVNRRSFSCKSQNNLMQFSLVFITIINFFSSVPSLGSRFIQLSYPLIAFLWLSNVQSLRRFDWMIYIVPFLWYFKIDNILEHYSMVTSISTILTNPLTQIFTYL